jgi:hypothetical protein
MPQYKLAADAEADRLDAEAAVSSDLVHRNIQRSANYVLGVVMFAVALFLAGMSMKLSGPRLRVALLVCGYVVFLSTVTWIATFPVKTGV